MSELAKTQTSQAGRSFGEQFAVGTIVVLLIAVQALFIAKHPVTLNTAAAPAALGVTAP